MDPHYRLIRKITIITQILRVEIMNIVEALQAHAETHPTIYFLNGKMAYPDEIFCVGGFLPLIGRMAEQSVRRSLAGQNLGQCGFVYTPFRNSLFCEKIDVMPVDAGILEDSMRLSFLCNASANIVGMGYDGAIDLTPVYDFFMRVRVEDRDALVDHNEESTWPLYQRIQAS